MVLTLRTKIPFGPYKGKSVAQTLRINRGVYWLELLYIQTRGKEAIGKVMSISLDAEAYKELVKRRESLRERHT